MPPMAGSEQVIFEIFPLPIPGMVEIILQRMNLKCFASFIFAAAIFISTGPLFAADEVIESTNNTYGLPSKNSPEVQWWRDSQTNLDTRLAWWRDARFGMFIHWGVYSGLGNQFQGRRGGGYAEHIQRILKIPIPVYRKEVAGNF